MTVLLVRHACAGDPAAFPGNDRVRPLDATGEEQARKLVALLGGYRPARILTSPFDRCVQTVAPLAEQLGLDVECVAELAEGAASRCVDLIGTLAPGEAVVLCTHGDVIPHVLEALAAGGVDVGTRPQWEKGSTWVLEPGAGPAGVASASYLAAPV